MTYWEPAGPPTPAVIADAKAWLAEMAPLLGRARPDAVVQWLTALALQTAGSNMTAADAAAKAAAYASTLVDEPGHSFSTGTLKAAARHFKWFPSVAEITEFLAKETKARRAQAEVARRLAESPPVENAEARYRKPPTKIPHDVELRQLLSRERVRRFGPIPTDAEVWRGQMAVCAEALGVQSPWADKRQAAA